MSKTLFLKTYGIEFYFSLYSVQSALRQIREHNPFSLLPKQGFYWKFQRDILHNDTYDTGWSKKNGTHVFGYKSIPLYDICLIF